MWKNNIIDCIAIDYIVENPVDKIMGFPPFPHRVHDGS